MRNKKRILYFKAVAILLVLFVGIMDALMLFIPDAPYSATENRNLKQNPSFSLKSFFSGRYEEDFDEYVADQFPFRVIWMRAMSAVERLFGKTESQGVYLGKDGYLIRDFTVPSSEDYLETMRAIQAFKTNYPEIKQTMLLAPTAITILDDKLPLFAPRGKENTFIDHVKAETEQMGISFIDVRDSFANASDDTQLYYRTDHHWTTQAAYLAYRELASELGLVSVKTNYTPVQISDSFSGTLTASSGFRMDETDALYVFVPEEENCLYTIEYTEEGEKTSFFLKTEQLATRDHYTVFFGGNHAQIRIKTANENGRVLLVLKDSYANCFIPFLIPDYQEILVIDPRYYMDDIGTLISTEQVTEVLYLYNASTFATDRSLRRELTDGI